jgi:hypothetical protein
MTTLSVDAEDRICPLDGVGHATLCVDPDDVAVSATCKQCGHTWVLMRHEPLSGCPCMQCRVASVCGEGRPRTVTKEFEW